jgi:hypothetical protein
MSLRDISFILKKGQANHGTATIKDNNNWSHSIEKTTQAYRLFSEGKTPVEVAIQLSLSEKEATRFYTEYWRLKHLYNLYQIYKESKGDLSYILKLCRLAKRQGIRADNIECFFNLVYTALTTSQIFKSSTQSCKTKYKSLTTKM